MSPTRRVLITGAARRIGTAFRTHYADHYTVPKCFGEALCAYYAERENLSCIAVRIGAFQPPEAVADSTDPRMLALFVSHRDLTQLLHRCIEAPDHVRHLLVQGVSDNQFK